ncbi:hypothetical protein BAE44_0004130 [Dichanthelium oligosanthes]|uniref:HTH myb-type domain-containing protein n=1 Tax=Dichanthelium oligosanthes TaxID=888268 RepID=A0A1E5WBP8_9POAL|nr:hypothetical protein BAE44_0004130 [Dichanthelium oligosanthes]
MQPTRSFLRWSDDLHMIFVKAVVYLGGPHAKPFALKETMEAMGVMGLTIQNIKSHLQKYRGKFELGAEACDEVPSTTSLSKAALDQAAKILMDTDTVMLEMEMVNSFLMDDVEMVDNNFSVDLVQMMEKELMDEIQVVHGYNDNEANLSCSQLIEHNSQYPQTVIDEYIADLANYAFGHL